MNIVARNMIYFEAQYSCNNPILFGKSISQTIILQILISQFTLSLLSKIMKRVHDLLP
jgi:hypothetical protein